jgi:hypothetical protein
VGIPLSRKRAPCEILRRKNSLKAQLLQIPFRDYRSKQEFLELAIGNRVFAKQTENRQFTP